MKKKKLYIDWQLWGFGILFVIAIALSIWYGVWYWNNCAFVPLFEAPSLCFANQGK